MRPNVKHAVYMVWAVLACCCLSSCAKLPHYTIRTQEIPILATEPQQQIPLRAGFYMDERWKNPTYTGPGSYLYYEDYKCKTRVVDIDLLAAFEQATRMMFKEVVLVSATDTAEDLQAKNLDVVVSVGPVTCESYFARVGDSVLSEALHVTLAAEWSVSSVDGRLVTSTKAIGKGKVKAGQVCRDVLVDALDAHFKKAYADIVMTGWWRDSSWKSK